MSVTRRRYHEGGNTIRSRKATAENDKGAFCAKIVIFAQEGLRDIATPMKFEAK
jgi:hypothetical protein